MTDKDQRCKGCGAPIKGRTCEYCGRVFDEPYITEAVLYADNIPIQIESIRSEIDSLQYQASMERQMEYLRFIQQQMTNVFPLRGGRL